MSSSKSVSVVSSIPGLLTELKKVLPLVNFVQVDVNSKDRTVLENSEIILADPHLVAPFFYNLPKTKWIQGTWAGVDKIIPQVKPNQLPNLTYTRFSGENFGQLIGEYVVATIVFHERNFFKVIENQKNKEYTRKDVPCEHRSLNEMTVGILGPGTIGSRIGKFLHNFGATIHGCGRREKISVEDTENRHISKYYQSGAELPNFLNDLDYLVNILPTTDETTNILGGGVLKNCKERGTVFINVGRGTVIKEFELIQALQEKWITGAILDVFETEPLPKESLLWNMPNVFITPHVSGYSRAQDVAKLFKRNYELYEKNQPLKYTVDFTQKY